MTQGYLIRVPVEEMPGLIWALELAADACRDAAENSGPNINAGNLKQREANLRALRANLIEQRDQQDGVEEGTAGGLADWFRRE